jgi:hypothetical protein
MKPNKRYLLIAGFACLGATAYFLSASPENRSPGPLAEPHQREFLTQIAGLFAPQVAISLAAFEIHAGSAVGGQFFRPAIRSGAGWRLVAIIMHPVDA